MKNLIAGWLLLSCAWAYAEVTEDTLDEMARVVVARDYAKMEQLFVQGIPQELRINYSNPIRYAMEQDDIELIKFLVPKLDVKSSSMAHWFSMGTFDQQQAILNALPPNKDLLNRMLHKTTDDVKASMLLLLRGADINSLNKEGDPLGFSLSWLSRKERNLYSRFLKSNGYNWNLKNKKGQTLLHVSALREATAVVNQLGQNPKAWTVLDNEGISAKAYLMATNRGAMQAEAFFDPLTLSQNDQNFAFKYAVRYSHVSAVYQLLKLFPDYEIQPDMARSIAESDAKIANLVFAHGFNLLQIPEGLQYYFWDEDQDIAKAALANNPTIPEGYFLEIDYIDLNEDSLKVLSAMGFNKDSLVTEDYTLGAYIEDGYSSELLAFFQDQATARQDLLTDASPNCGVLSSLGDFIGTWESEDDDQYAFNENGQFEFKRNFFGVHISKGSWQATNCGLELLHEDDEYPRYLPVVRKTQSQMLVGSGFGDTWFNRI